LLGIKGFLVQLSQVLGRHSNTLRAGEAHTHLSRSSWALGKSPLRQGRWGEPSASQPSSTGQGSRSAERYESVAGPAARTSYHGKRECRPGQLHSFVRQETTVQS